MGRNSVTARDATRGPLLPSVLAVLVAALVLCGCQPSWNTMRAAPYADPTTFRWSVVTTVPVTADSTAAVQSVLAWRVSHDRDTLQEWAASVVTTGALDRVVAQRVFTVYRRPASRPSGAVYDSLQPTHNYLVIVGADGRAFDSMLMGHSGGAWGLWDAGNAFVQKLQRLDAALGSRNAEVSDVRFVPYNGYLMWWVVRFRNGSEAAYADGYVGPVWVAGKEVSGNGIEAPGPYPTSVIFAEVRR